jgi:hypothetical protein
MIRIEIPNNEIVLVCDENFQNVSPKIPQ